MFGTSAHAAAANNAVNDAKEKQAQDLLKKYSDGLRQAEAGNEPNQLSQQGIAPQEQSRGAGSWLGQEQGKPWDLEARDPRGATGRGIPLVF